MQTIRKEEEQEGKESTEERLNSALESISLSFVVQLNYGGELSSRVICPALGELSRFPFPLNFN